MVARHASVPGWLFKKYSSTVSVDQCKNYDARVEGADRLRTFIAKHELKHVVVPDKQILDLPANHGRCEHVLLVEQLDLVSVSESERLYRTIADALLRELCLVLFHFRGLDSIIDNVPFTTGGKLAFIDTEHWYGGRRRPYLRYIRRCLSTENRRRAKRLFRQFARDNVAAVDPGVFTYEDDISVSALSASAREPAPVNRPPVDTTLDR